MTSLDPTVFNVGLLILLILFILWFLHSLARFISLYRLSSAYTRHELLHVEGLSRHSNLTRDHLLSILRARSTHVALPTDRYHLAAHVDTAVGKVTRVSDREATDPTSTPTPKPASDDIALYVRVSCTRVSRMDVFVGVSHLTIAQLYAGRGGEGAGRAGGRGKKGRFKFPGSKDARPAIDIDKANALRLATTPFLSSPSPPRSALMSSPSPGARSLTPRTDTQSTLGGLSAVPFQRKGVVGFPASASSSFLPLFGERVEEKRTETEGSERDSNSAKAVDAANEDSDVGPSPADPQTPMTTPHPTPLTRSKSLAQAEEEPAVLGGLTLTDLHVLLRNKSPADDDVHALHEDDFLHRIAPVVLEPCVDRDVMVPLPRDWLLSLHQRMEAAGGRRGDGTDLYAVVIQLRPIDESTLPPGRTPRDAKDLALEEKEKAADLFDATKPSPLADASTSDPLADDPTKRTLVAELTMMDYQRHIPAAEPGASPRPLPRSLFSLSPVSSSATPSQSARSLSPTPGGGAAASPASFEQYLAHLRFAHQLLLTPAMAVYHVEELYGLEPEHRDCIVCLTEPKDIVLLPCRHVCVCHVCHRSVTKCPVCRGAILNYAKWEDDSKDKDKDKGDDRPRHPGLLDEDRPRDADPPRKDGDGGEEVEMVTLRSELPDDGKMQHDDGGGDGEGKGEWDAKEEAEVHAEAPTSPTTPRSFPPVVSAEKVAREDGGGGGGGGGTESVADGSVAAPNSPALSGYD